MTAAVRPDPAVGSSAPAHRSRFRTTDTDEALAFLDTMYAARPTRFQALDPTTPLCVTQVRAGDITRVDADVAAHLTVHLDGTDDLSVVTVVRGTAEAELGGTTERFGPGDVCLGAFPQGSYDVTSHDVRVEVLTVPAQALTRASGTAHEERTRPVRFASLAPVSSAAAAQWTRAATFVRELLDDDEAAANPIVVGSAAQLLAATALALLPTALAPDPPSQSSPTPDTLRRALDHIHAHADTDIDLADIAAAAAVTPRAVQLAFRRHLDTTPMRYLRRVRLERAHDDLVEADPADGTTVTAVAARWGFTRAGRFAADYLEAFGTHPSRTLHDTDRRSAGTPVFAFGAADLRSRA